MKRKRETWEREGVGRKEGREGGSRREEKGRKKGRRSNEVKMTSLTFPKGQDGILSHLGRLVGLFSVSFMYFSQRWKNQVTHNILSWTPP